MDFELRAPRCLARSLSSPMEQDDADETEPTGETVAPDDDAPATEAEPSDLKRTHDEAGVKETVNPDRNDWLCAACIQFKAPFETPENPGVLLMCDGPCRRSWHTDCLEVDMPESDEWFCPDCSDNTHPCSFCGDTASEGNAVSKCSVSGCRFFFHVNCVLENPQAFQGLAAGAEQGGGGGYGGGGAEHSLSFRCRGHVCETCFDVPGVATKSKRSLVKCQLCPTAWHPQCVSRLPLALRAPRRTTPGGTELAPSLFLSRARSRAANARRPLLSLWNSRVHLRVRSRAENARCPRRSRLASFHARRSPRARASRARSRSASGTRTWRCRRPRRRRRRRTTAAVRPPTVRRRRRRARA